MIFLCGAGWLSKLQNKHLRLVQLYKASPLRIAIYYSEAKPPISDSGPCRGVQIGCTLRESNRSAVLVDRTLEPFECSRYLLPFSLHFGLRVLALMVFS